MTRSFKLVADEPRDVPALGLLDVQPGDTIDVEDPALSEGLEGQTDVWEHIPDPQRSKAAKKAAQTRAADDDSQEG